MDRQIVSAAPGWAVAVPWEVGDGIIELHHEPVVAWIVSYDNENDEDHYYPWAMPVTVETPIAGENVLRRPDGTYIAPENRSFKDSHEVLSYYRDEKEKRKRRHAAKHRRRR